MTRQADASVTLDILEIGARGDGIAEHEGRRYFVPFTLPGETVEAELRDKRGEGIAADLVEVLAPSRHRESPPCAHFKIVRRLRPAALASRRLHGLEGRPDRSRAVAARRRSTALRTTSGRRAGRAASRRLRAAPAGQARLAGFHERTSPRVVDVGVCVVARPNSCCASGAIADSPRIDPAGWRIGGCRGERNRQWPRRFVAAAQALRSVAGAARSAGGAG